MFTEPSRPPVAVLMYEPPKWSSGETEISPLLTAPVTVDETMVKSPA